MRYFANMNTHTHTKALSLCLSLWWWAITNPDHAPSLTPCSFCCARGWGPVNAAPRLSGSKADTAHSVFSWDHWIIEDPLLRLNRTGFHHDAGGHFDFPLYTHHICNNAAETSQFQVNLQRPTTRFTEEEMELRKRKLRNWWLKLTQSALFTRFLLLNE